MARKSAVRSKLKWDFECAVVGGGPAGIAASVYLARFRRSTAIFDHGTPRVYWAPRIQNLLGYEKSIKGSVLLEHYRSHLRRYPQVKRVDAPGRVERRGKGFLVTTPKGIYTARKVLLATGVSDAQPALENLADLRRRGFLRYCSICDGYEMKGKRIAVFAKDDSGIQKALFLSNWTKKIALLVPEGLELSPTRERQVRAVGIEVVRSNSVTLRSNRRTDGVTVSSDHGNPFRCAVGYIELGCHVKDSAYASLRNLRKVEGGFIVATAEQRTSIPGLFAAGDCVNRLGQVSVALGQAAIAATNIHEELMRP